MVGSSSDRGAALSACGGLHLKRVHESRLLPVAATSRTLYTQEVGAVHMNKVLDTDPASSVAIARCSCGQPATRSGVWHEAPPAGRRDDHAMILLAAGTLSLPLAAVVGLLMVAAGIWR